MLRERSQLENILGERNLPQNTTCCMISLYRIGRFIETVVDKWLQGYGRVEWEVTADGCRVSFGG